MSTPVAIFAVGVSLMAPILWATLGELLMEKSGVLNVGIEGVMLLSAFAAAAGYKETGQLEMGIVFAVATGGACGVLLAILYVRLGTDQVVTGIMFNVFAFGLTAALYEQYLGTNVATTLPDVAIPVLSSIPALGDIFFNQNLLIYAAFLAGPALYYLLNKTWYGLHLQAAGEAPKAVESGGLDVWRVRYPAVIIGCILVGLGGATLVASTSGGFVLNITAGRGFIALAVVVLIQWKPLLALAGALLFGVAQSLQFQAQSLGPLGDIPSDFILMLPYVVTLVAVVLVRGSRYPAACGVPFKRAA